MTASAAFALACPRGGGSLQPREEALFCTSCVPAIVSINVGNWQITPARGRAGSDPLEPLPGASS